MNDLSTVSSSSVRRSLLALSTCVVPTGDAVAPLGHCVEGDVVVLAPCSAGDETAADVAAAENTINIRVFNEFAEPILRTLKNKIFFSS